jgi:membrane fusion protein, multidrug efflux system
MVVSHVTADRPVEKYRRRAPVLIGLAMVAVVAGGYAAARYLPHSSPTAPQAPPPIPVIATMVKTQDFPLVMTGIGYVMAMRAATVRSMVTEPIISIDFHDGQFVKQGQLLAQLDPGTYQAQLDEADADLARDEAHLANAQINLRRYVPLERRGFAPEQQVTTQEAQIAQLEATIRADQATVESAKIELGYTRLVAPFDGSVGIRLLDVGNIIHSTTTRGSPSEPNALVVINQVQPISVIFTLAAVDTPAVQDALAKGAVRAIALSADGKTALDTGTLTAINNQANASSGTISLRAVFPNANRRLWPGMFVNVRIVMQIENNGVTVPLDAVQQGPQGQYVFVVSPNHRAAMQLVSVTETLNGEALINSGLSAGETVVVRGQYRLTPGALVLLANSNESAEVPKPTAASAGLLP